MPTALAPCYTDQHENPSALYPLIVSLVTAGFAVVVGYLSLDVAAIYGAAEGREVTHPARTIASIALVAVGVAAVAWSGLRLADRRLGQDINRSTR